MVDGRRVFLTGATGYIGGRLIPELCARGHLVTALVRQNSQRKLPSGCTVAFGNALDGDSYGESLGGADTFIHLVGVSHPSPAKAQQFVEIDGKSAEEAIRVATKNKIRHFIYLSVAQPAPVMRAYASGSPPLRGIPAGKRLECHDRAPLVRARTGSSLAVRLTPAVLAGGAFSRTREFALRLGFVTIRQMIEVLAAAVDNPPPAGLRIIEVPEIRQLTRDSAP